MNLKKIKSILKSKRVQIIGGTVCGALALTLIGTIVLNNRNIESKIIVSDNKTIGDKDQNNKLENIKDNVADNLIEEDKAENNNQLKEDNSIKDDPASSNVIANEANVPLSESNKSTSNNTEKQNTINKPITSVSNTQGNGTSNGKQEVESTKPSVSSSSSNSKPNNSTSNTPKPDKHTHNWVAITTTVHHKEQGHNEKVLVSEAWTEEVPIYEEKEVMICNDCGVELNPSNCYDHVENHLLNGGKGSWREEWKKVQVGTNKINHEAVYENKWVVDKAAWDETVTTGHKCSGCGETK
ncbi:hypothetical protein [uncultured Clostridium sp.]|uniref:hypothetical protein n=1 Tax=uncultured Clostridium sp. TaxID=59620 RepID=UPI0027314AA5|nr:hypothetical protein [uncultured Clostridium sp.]